MMPHRYVWLSTLFDFVTVRNPRAEPAILLYASMTRTSKTRFVHSAERKRKRRICARLRKPPPSMVRHYYGQIVMDVGHLLADSPHIASDGARYAEEDPRSWIDESREQSRSSRPASRIASVVVSTTSLAST